jgi:hypothetical protein
MGEERGINPAALPSGAGCLECEAEDGWWLHLRRCAQCGHIGCCDSSPSRHARAHAAEQRHRVARTFEPGEDWFWDYVGEKFMDGPELEPPQHRPLDQPSPGPEGRVPADWKSLLHKPSGPFKPSAPLKPGPGES